MGGEVKVVHTASTAALELACSVSLVRVLVREGRLRPIARTPTGIRLYDDDAVQALKREREERDR